MKNLEINNFEQYFSKNVRTYYILASLAIITAYIVDTILFYSKLNAVVLSINLISITTIVMFFAFGFFKKIKISTSYLFIIYSTILGLFFAYSYDLLYRELLANFVIRNIIIFPIFIFSVGLLTRSK